MVVNCCWSNWMVDVVLVVVADTVCHSTDWFSVVVALHINAIGAHMPNGEDGRCCVDCMYTIFSTLWNTIWKFSQRAIVIGKLPIGFKFILQMNWRTPFSFVSTQTGRHDACNNSNWRADRTFLFQLHSFILFSSWHPCESSSDCWLLAHLILSVCLCVHWCPSPYHRVCRRYSLATNFRYLVSFNLMACVIWF